MAQQTVGTTDTLNVGRVKINENFTEVYANAAAASAAAATNASDIADLDTAKADATHTHTSRDVTVNVTTQTGTTYTPVLTDANGYIRCNNAGAITVTLPLNATVAYPTGTTLSFEQAGAGQVTLAITGGGTLNKPSTHNLATASLYAVVQVIKIATDTWIAFGNMEAV